MPSSTKQKANDDQKLYKKRRNASLSLNIKYTSFYILNKDSLNKENIIQLINSFSKNELELLDWLEQRIKGALS